MARMRSQLTFSNVFSSLRRNHGKDFGIRLPISRSSTLIAALAVGIAAVPTASARTQHACSQPRWLEAWTAPPSDAAPTYSDQSLRLVLTPLRSGNDARVRLSNRFGSAPITFGSAFIGRQAHGATLVPGSNQRLTFAGARQATVPAGREVVSDPVKIHFSAFEHVAVSVYVAAPGGHATEHAQAVQTSFISPVGSGDLAGHEGAGGYGETTIARPFVTGLETRVGGREGVLVAVGDAVTDGGGSGGIDKDIRYPDFLARRLQHPLRGVRYSVLNAGIGGNAIRGNIIGPSLLSRLDTDVLARPGVTDVIVLEGGVDLGLGASPNDVITGLNTVVNRLQAFRAGGRPDLNVLVGTLTPTEGATLLGFGTAAVNSAREQVNDFIRTSGIGDGYIDFDRALVDPNNPGHLLPLYDSGDHLHPSSGPGYDRMAHEVKLSELEGPACRHNAAPSKPKIKATVNRDRHTATLRFKANRASRYQCALIKLRHHRKPAKPHFSSCKSPTTYKRLTAGKYTFEVRGTTARKAGPTTKKGFTI